MNGGMETGSQTILKNSFIKIFCKFQLKNLQIFQIVRLKDDYL